MYIEWYFCGKVGYVGLILLVENKIWGVVLVVVCLCGVLLWWIVWLGMLCCCCSV